jgi:hypothetical protein
MIGRKSDSPPGDQATERPCPWALQQPPWVLGGLGASEVCDGLRSILCSSSIVAEHRACLRASLVLAFLPALFLWPAAPLPRQARSWCRAAVFDASLFNRIDSGHRDRPRPFHDPLRLRASIGCQRTTGADLLARELARLSADVSFVARGARSMRGASRYLQ